MKPHTLKFAALALLMGTTPAAFAESAAEAVTISDPYVRMVPPGQQQTGAYLLLRNTGKADHALVKAASPAARAVELHTVVDEGGVKKMRPVPKMDVKAGGETKLQPGGLHIMLIGLNEPLREGADVALTLGFEDGSEKKISAPVRAIMAPMMMPRH